MGVLNINMRRESLNNLGGIPKAQTDDGSVALARAQVAAAELRQRHASDIPLAVASLGNDLKEAAEQWRQMIDRNRQRRFDAYSAHVQDEFNTYMLGDGSAENQGRYNEHPTDTLTWAKEIQEKYAEISKKYREEYKIDDREWQDHVEKGDRAYRMQWAGRVIDRANSLNDSNAKSAAKLKLENIERTLSLGDGTPQLYTDWAEGVANVCKVNNLDPNTATEFRRAKAMSMEQTGVGLLINKVREEASAAQANGGDGEAVWAAAIENLEKNTDEKSFCPPNALAVSEDGKAVNIIGEWLTDDDKRALRDGAIKAAKNEQAKWVAGLKASVIKSFEDGQAQILAMPAPEEGDLEGQKRYQREVADAYLQLIAKPGAIVDPNDKELTWVRDEYKKNAPHKVNLALKAINGANVKYDRARVKLNGILFDKTLEIGIPDENTPGAYRPLSAAEKVQMAEFLYLNDEISHADYVRAMKSAKQDLTPLAKQFLAQASRGMQTMFPKVCKWQENTMSYVFDATEEGMKIATLDTGIESEYQGADGDMKEETILYQQYADAMSTVMQGLMVRGKRAGETDAECLTRAKKELDELTHGTNEALGKLSFKRRREEYREKTKQIKQHLKAQWDKISDVTGLEYSQRTKARYGIREKSVEAARQERKQAEKDAAKKYQEAYLKQPLTPQVRPQENNKNTNETK